MCLYVNLVFSYYEKTEVKNFRDHKSCLHIFATNAILSRFL